MIALLVVIVVLNSLILIAVIAGLALAAKRLSKTMDAAEKTMIELSTKLPETLDAATDAMRSVESVANQAESILHSTDRLVSGATIAEVAVKTVRSGKVGLGRVIAGALEVLRALKSPTDTTKEGSENG